MGGNFLRVIQHALQQRQPLMQSIVAATIDIALVFAGGNRSVADLMNFLIALVDPLDHVLVPQPTKYKAPRISRFSGLFFVYRKILEASARFPLHVHALVQGFGSDSATPLGHPTASPVLEVNADQNQLLH